MLSSDPSPALVSCVMATRDRPSFVRQAIRCFLRQSYGHSELLIVDDGEKPVGYLCRGAPRVRYLRTAQPTPTGTKLNLAIDEARGRVIQKLDDDDFYHSEFLAQSVARLPLRGLRSNLVCRCCFYVLLAGDPRLRHSGHGWNTGGSLCFHRALWKQIPFRDVAYSEDSWFLRDHRPRLIRICNTDPYIVVRHGRNTWKMMSTGETTEQYFARRPALDVTLRGLVPAEDWPFYRKLSRAIPRF